MTWSTACLDWERRIAASESLIPCGALYPDEAEAALDVFRSLRVVDVAGEPTMGEIARPWVLDFVRAIFGAYDAENGRRRIVEFFQCISKKNTKSTTAAGIMLTALVRNWRKSAELLILAPTIEIANNSFFPARDMVRADPELSALLLVQDHVRTITHRQTGATLKVVAADGETVGGKKAAFILVDEIWLFGKRPDAENMLREATGGLASRPEGFIIYLTTQSDEPPAGVFKQKLDYARAVRDGRIADPAFLPVLYEFPPAMLATGAHLRPENWHVTNPNLGASVDEAFLAREFAKAQESGPKSVTGFLAKHLNVEPGGGMRSGSWVGAEHWSAAAEPELTLDSIVARCDVAVVGIDGGGLDDLLGLAVLGRERGSRRWLHWARAWAHPTVLARNRKEASRLEDFIAAGDLVLVQRPGQDVDEVAAIVQLLASEGLLPEKAAVGVDPAGIGVIVDALADAGIAGEMVVGVPQGWRMSGAIKTTERKLSEGMLVHCGQALMGWAVGNARAEPKGNAVAIEKAVAGSGKINPLVALFCAIALMTRNPSNAGDAAAARHPRSGYEMEPGTPETASRGQHPASGYEAG